MIKRTSLLLAGTALISGCSTFQAAHKANDKAIGAVKAAKAERGSFVSSSSQPYLVGAEVAAKKPESPLLKRQVNDKSLLPQSIQHIAGVITAQTNIPVEVTGMGSAADSGGNGSNGGKPAAGQNGKGNGSLPPPPAAFLRHASAPKRNAGSLPKIRVFYDGSLKGFLQKVDAKAGISSRVSGGAIVLFRTETKTFTIPSLPESTDSVSDIESGSGTSSAGESGGMGYAGGGAAMGAAGGVSGSSSNQSGGTTSIKTTLKTDIWKSLSRTAKTVAPGAQVAVNKALGTVTVTGTPEQIATVHQWVRGLDKSLEKQVAVTVKVYDVQLSHEQNYGFNPTVAFRNAAKTFGMSMTGAPVPQVLGGGSPMQFRSTILKTAKGDAGRLRGTSAAVQALATLGRVSTVFERSFTSLNDEEVPIQVGTKQEYPAESFSNLAANVGSSTGIIPGHVTTGFTGNFFPRIERNKVFLAARIKLSSLVNMQKIVSNGTQLEYPTTSHAEIDQTAALRSGSTLMITGYGKNSASNTHNGTGSPFMPALGGGADAQLKRNLIAIVVTARIL